MTQTPPISAEQVEAILDSLMGAVSRCSMHTTHEAAARLRVEMSRALLLHLSLNAAASIPASRGAETEGWVLVPREATAAMIDAGEEITINCIPSDTPDASIIYRAMLAASPAPLPVEEQELIGRLRAACVGHPHAVIEWPHRLLHDAIAALEALSPNLALKAEIERLQAALRNIAEGNLGDQSWQANYRRIAEVARAALEPKP